MNVIEDDQSKVYVVENESVEIYFALRTDTSKVP